MTLTKTVKVVAEPAFPEEIAHMQSTKSLDQRD